MNIAHIMGTSTSSALEALYGEQKKKDEQGEGGVASWKRDSVTISEEALALARQLGKTSGQVGTSEQANSEADSRQAEQEGGEEGVSASGGGGGAGATESTIKQLEARIKELTSKLQSVMSSNLPEESKQAMISSIQAELAAAQQELNALQSSA